MTLLIILFYKLGHKVNFNRLEQNKISEFTEFYFEALLFLLHVCIFILNHLAFTVFRSLCTAVKSIESHHFNFPNAICLFHFLMDSSLMMCM